MRYICVVVASAFFFACAEEPVSRCIICAHTRFMLLSGYIWKYKRRGLYTMDYIVTRSAECDTQYRRHAASHPGSFAFLSAPHLRGNCAGPLYIILYRSAQWNGSSGWNLFLVLIGTTVFRYTCTLNVVLYSLFKCETHLPNPLMNKNY